MDIGWKTRIVQWTGMLIGVENKMPPENGNDFELNSKPF